MHSKDVKNLDIVIDAAEEHIADIGTIYVISKEKYTDRAIWIDESLYPFSIDDVGKELGGRGGVGNHIRCGWYYQQLLKFYTSFVVKDLSFHFLILDADTIALRDIEFITEDNKVCLNVTRGTLRYPYYYIHMASFLPSLDDVDRSINPVVNHMVFSKDILVDLFKKVEGRYKKPFWKAFLNTVDAYKKTHTKAFYMGASEYLLYYHFCMKYHPEKVMTRVIKNNSRHRCLSKYHPYGDYDFITGHLFVTD